MSTPEVTDVRTCRFPGCEEPIDATPGVGRPPAYCTDPAHNRSASWRARHAEVGHGQRAAEDEKFPVDAALQRGGLLRAQLLGMAEHFQQQFALAVGELQTIADPEAAEVQIEAVKADAAEQVASAAARANRAETAMREAEADRAEADAAAEESAGLVEDLRTAVAALEQRAATLEKDLVLANEDAVGAAAEIETLTGQVAALSAENTATSAQLVDAREALATTAAAKDEATATARDADVRAYAASARADRSEAEAASTRDQLDQVRVEREGARAEALVLTGQLATALSERESAATETARERTFGEQRVTDLRVAYEQQIALLRADLEELRAAER